MPSPVPMIGRQFGRLTVEKQAPLVVSGGRFRRHFECRCECGASKVVCGEHLRAGSIRSCGCLRVETTSARRLKHGDTQAGTTSEYYSWAHMVQRCTNSKNKDFRHYGGRGIKVCDRWLNSYADFLSDMGRKPTPKHSIDREDNNGNYEPGNVRWATQSQQVANRRYLGRKMREAA